MLGKRIQNDPARVLAPFLAVDYNRHILRSAKSESGDGGRRHESDTAAMDAGCGVGGGIPPADRLHGQTAVGISGGRRRYTRTVSRQGGHAGHQRPTALPGDALAVLPPRPDPERGILRSLAPPDDPDGDRPQDLAAPDRRGRGPSPGVVNGRPPTARR